MTYPVITTCPVCDHALKITRLRCSHCQTTIENQFELSRLASLSSEQHYFIEMFLKCRGNIKEVEKELGISYPTVRSKLNDIVRALGYAEPDKKPETDERKIIQMLENGEITADDAVMMLKKRRGDAER